MKYRSGNLATTGQSRGAASPVCSAEMTWALVYLLFLCYFMFQSHLPQQGYVPFRTTAYVTYIYRTLICTFLFFGLVLWFVPARCRARVGEALLCSHLLLGLAYMCVVVAARPELAPLNDRAEALSLSLNSLFRLSNPYLCVTHLGGAITVLTTPFIIALPAEILFGRPELMNIPVLISVSLLLEWQRRRVGSSLPAPALAMVIFLSPTVAWELMWGSDLLWGGALLVGAMVLLDAGKLRLSGFVFGLALCTRLAFFYLIPLWAIYVFRKHGKRSWPGMLTTISVVLVLELPFVLWDPHVFFSVAPLGTSAEKLFQIFPHGDNALSDILNLIPLEGAARAFAVSTVILVLSALLALRTTTTASLALGMSAMFGVMIFAMGPFFLLDYLVYMTFPLAMALIGGAEARLRGASASELMMRCQK